MVKKKWQEFKKQTTIRKVVWSIVTSLVILVGSYIICNTSIPLPDEIGVLQWFDKFKSFNGINKDSIPNEVILINVSFDKQLVDYEKNNVPVGQYAITDRQKLYDFLQLAHKANNYKYIFLDVIFEEGIVSEYDSMLFHRIASMDRIVIPMHEDTPLQDSILYNKAANADYTVTWKETNFARYKFLWDGVPSIPLKMYEELDGKTISKLGPLFTSCNWICQNGLTLQLPIKITEDLSEEDTRMQFNVLQLGVDILSLDSIAPVANEIKDKIVVIGDFYTDVHDTYIGPQPGSIICLNAYYALQRGDHIIMGKYGLRLLFYILIFIVYFVMTLCYLNGFSLSAITDHPFLKAIISFGSISALYWIIAVVGYIAFDTVYNFWIPIVFFSIVGTITYIYTTYKKLKNEKTKIISTPESASNISDGRQLQSHLPEQSKNND